MGERAGSARGSTPGASRAARIEQGETQSPAGPRRHGHRASASHVEGDILVDRGRG